MTCHFNQYDGLKPASSTDPAEGYVRLSIVGFRALTVVILLVRNVTAAGGVEKREHCVDILRREKRCLLIGVSDFDVSGGSDGATACWGRRVEAKLFRVCSHGGGVGEGYENYT